MESISLKTPPLESMSATAIFATATVWPCFLGSWRSLAKQGNRRRIVSFLKSPGESGFYFLGRCSQS
jgi:hypothetical protein